MKKVFKSKVFLIIVGLLVAGGIVGVLVYKYTCGLKRCNTDQDMYGAEPSVAFESLPVYPKAARTSDAQFEDGFKRVVYEAPFGITSKDVMDFYEQKLIAKGWSRVLRDVDDRQLEMLSPDQDRVRVWIYFEGLEDDYNSLPLTFIVDFGVVGGEFLPVPVQ